MRKTKIIALVMLLVMAAGILSGCHGTMDRNAVLRLGGDAEKPSSRQAAVPAVTPLVASSSVTGIGGMEL